MAKPKPMFEYAYPEVNPAESAFVQVVYGEEPLAPVPIETAKRYSRFMDENVANSDSAMPDLFIVTLPVDPTVGMKSVQAVVESLVNGRIKIPMDERLRVLRAATMLRVDVLTKALQDHLKKGCRSRPFLKLQCLEEVFDSPDDDEFRRQRFDDVRRNFTDVAVLKEWTKLNADVVRELLSAGLEAKEIDVYRAVMKWLACNGLQIPAQADRLLGMVRFGSMSTPEKFDCLKAARRLNLDVFVRPYIIEADWYRTCHELNHPEFTNLVERERRTQFIGENRRSQSVRAHYARSQRQMKVPGNGITVDTNPSALDRVLAGAVSGGTWMARPRAMSAESAKASSEASSVSTGQSRMSTKNVRTTPPMRGQDPNKERMQRRASSNLVGQG